MELHLVQFSSVIMSSTRATSVDRSKLVPTAGMGVHARSMWKGQNQATQFSRVLAKHIYVKTICG